MSMTSEKTKPATITKPFRTPNVCGPNGQNGNRHIVHMIITSTSQEDIKSADRISPSSVQVKTKTAAFGWGVVLCRTAAHPCGHLAVSLPRSLFGRLRAAIPAKDAEKTCISPGRWLTITSGENAGRVHLCERNRRDSPRNLLRKQVELVQWSNEASH